MGLEDLVGIAADAGSDAAARSAQSAEGKKSRKFTERMYKQRYQNTMDDMLAAGLNPILAGNLGAGSVGSTPIANLGQNKLGAQSLSRGFEAMSAKAQVGLTKQSTKVAQALELKHLEDAGLSKTQEQLARAGIPRARTLSEFDASPLGRKLTLWQHGGRMALEPLGSAASIAAKVATPFMLKNMGVGSKQFRGKGAGKLNRRPITPIRGNPNKRKMPRRS